MKGLEFMNQKPQSEWTPEEAKIASVVQEENLAAAKFYASEMSVTSRIRREAFDEVIKRCRENIEDINDIKSRGPDDKEYHDGGIDELSALIMDIEEMKK